MKNTNAKLKDHQDKHLRYYWIDNFYCFRLPTSTLNDLYISILEPLRRLRLTEKEYVLLKTIIYCYNPLEDLSEYAKSILRQQSEKYSQLLLKHQQLEYGEIKGALRYAEVISLIRTFFEHANKHRQVFFLSKMALEQRKDKEMLRSPTLVKEIMHYTSLYDY